MGEEAYHPYHPNHQLELKHYTTKPFICDGCKKPGLGPRYRCEACDYDLHKHCMHFKSTATHNFFPNCVFKFYRGPGDNALNCDGCAKPVKGYLYHCDEKGWDLHPGCMNLNQKLRLNDVDLTLCSHVSKKCSWCRNKKLEGSCRYSPGWWYVSDCKKKRFHVSCVGEMVLEGCNGNYGTLELASLNSDRRVVRRGRSRGSTLKRVLKLFFKALWCVFTGDPATTVSLLVELFSG